MLIYFKNTNNLQTMKSKVVIIEIQVKKKHAFNCYDKIQFLL
jgi:hypothetical protein